MSAPHTEVVMGCDIHMVVELYDWVPDGKGDEVRAWSMVVAEPATYGDRNYSLFGALAGVRGTASPISAPRGLPADASSETAQAAARMGEDGHSHSWVTLDEVAAYDWSAIPWGGCGFPEWALGLPKGPVRMKRAPLAHIRLVFWFDN